MIDRPQARRPVCLALALAAVVATLFAAGSAHAGAPGFADVVARVKATRAHGRPALIVFGLDQALLDPAARTRDILTRALEGPGAMVTPEQPALAEQVRSLPLAEHAFDPESTLARAGIVDTAMVRALSTRWRQDFYTNRFLDDDAALPGAVRYVDSLYAAGGTIVYFAGRDARHMLAGTAQALLGRGFPVGVVRTQLILKPDPRMDTLAWARGALDDVAALGDVVAVFDSETSILLAEHARFPRALVFQLDRPHSANAPAPPPGAVRAPDYASFAP